MANHTILLIDYEPRSIERFRDPLAGAGYNIEIATDGVSGIEAFHRLNPDMVLVEAMIPKKHGFEVCQELKRTPHGRKTPVIITTGVYKGRKYRTQALHIYGCDEYIEKPIAPEQLLELVGRFLKPGPSGSAPKSTERGPGESEAGGGSTSQDMSGSVARAGTARTTHTPRVVAEAGWENEISAHLDSILRDADAAKPDAFAGIHSNLATAVDPIAVTPPDIETTPEEDDPFAEIRAELNAELGALEPFDLEAANFEPAPDFIPSDQVLPPSILEAIPTPEPEVPIPPLSEPAPVLPVERPGRVVDFDSKRSRKHKKSKQGKTRATQAQSSSAPQPVPIAAPQEPTALRTLEPVASVAELTLPRGTIVESELEAPVANRGVPVWAWAVAGIIAVVGIYFIFSRDMPDRSVGGPAASTPSDPPASAASAAPPAPEEVAPQADSQRGSELPTDGAEPTEAPVVQAQRPAAPKKQAERPAKPAATAPPAIRPTTARVAPPPLQSAPKIEPPVAPLAAVAPPVGLDDTVAGVEALPDPAATTASTVATGALIPIDEADTLPVPLQRLPPVYSAQARQLRLSGTVVLNALINEQGTVDQVVLVMGVPGADLNEAAIRAAKSWTYRPATKNGVPVKVWKSEQIVFKK